MQHLDNLIILTSSDANPGDFIISPKESNESVDAATEQSSTGTETTTASTPSTSGSGMFQNPMFIMIFYVIVIGGAFYFANRSQRKKDQTIRDLQDNMKVGDDVHTSGGLFGKIVEKYDDKLIIEFGTNKGVRIPVRKTDVFPLKTDTDKPSK